MKSPKPNRHTFTSVLTLVATITIIAIDCVLAQSDSDPQPAPAPTPPALDASSITIYLGQDTTAQPKKHDSTFARVPLNPGQTVTIALQYDSAMSGQTVVADPLDGGVVSTPEGGLRVDENGVLTFQYQAGTSPGLCRIAIHQAGDGDTVQFWILDTTHPADNPSSFPQN